MPMKTLIGSPTEATSLACGHVAGGSSRPSSFCPFLESHDKLPTKLNYFHSLAFFRSSLPTGAWHPAAAEWRQFGFGTWVGSQLRLM